MPPKQISVGCNNIACLLSEQAEPFNNSYLQTSWHGGARGVWDSVSWLDDREMEQLGRSAVTKALRAISWGSLHCHM